MPAIYIMAIAVTLFATAIFVFLMKVLVTPDLCKWLVLLFLLELPLEPLSMIYVRRPIDTALVAAMGKTGLYYVTTVWYAPVTEELAKLLPVILFCFFTRIRKEDVPLWMLPIGFGFGIGEAWLIAEHTARQPLFANIPWYQFGGFFAERLEVCFIHAGMTGAGLLLSIGQGRWLLGTLLSMILHFFGNLPIFLMSPLVFNANQTVAAILMTIWTLFYAVGAIAIMLGNEGAAKLGLKLFGRAKCPRCQSVYDRPLLAMNMGSFRYERCPNCKTWNKTTNYVGQPAEAK